MLFLVLIFLDSAYFKGEKMKLNKLYLFYYKNMVKYNYSVICTILLISEISPLPSLLGNMHRNSKYKQKIFNCEYLTTLIL